MKKQIYLFIFVATTICCCEEEGQQQVASGLPFDINFYAAKNVPFETNAVQLTLKSEEVQMTAFGTNTNGSQRQISKIYLSDTETKTEWIILLNDHLKPEFVYGINSQTKKKLPYLYGIEDTGVGRYKLRSYEYDWPNRLGTLQYEAEVAGENVSVIFDNANSNGGRLGKSARAYPAPVPGLSKHEGRGHRTNFSEADESIDQQFDDQMNDFLRTLQELKTKLIEAPCKVSKILNKTDRNFVCSLADQLNKVTDEKIFEDIQRVSDQPQSGEDFEYTGNSSSLDVQFFDETSVMDDIRRHLNNIRNAAIENLNWQEWLDELQQYTEITNEDLDDLPDSKGVIQIGLSWNSTADIDLHVMDPFNETIYFDNPTSSSGGYLDRDDTDGLGPENIYWTENIPDGRYTVSLVYYGPSDGPVSDFTVRVINGLGASETFSGALGYFEGTSIPIVTFTKNGNSIVF